MRIRGARPPLQKDKRQISLWCIILQLYLLIFYNDSLLNTISWIWFGEVSRRRRKRKKRLGKIFLFCSDCAKSLHQNRNCIFLIEPSSHLTHANLSFVNTNPPPLSLFLIIIPHLVMGIRCHLAGEKKKKLRSEGPSHDAEGAEEGSI